MKSRSNWQGNAHIELIKWLGGLSVPGAPAALLSTGVFVTPALSSAHYPFTAVRLAVIGIFLCSSITYLLLACTRVCKAEKFQPRGAQVATYIQGLHTPLWLCIAFTTVIAALHYSPGFTQFLGSAKVTWRYLENYHVLPLLAFPIVEYYFQVHSLLETWISRALPESKLRVAKSPSGHARRRRHVLNVLTWASTVMVYWGLFYLTHLAFGFVSGPVFAYFGKADMQYEEVAKSARRVIGVPEYSFTLQMTGFVYPTLCLYIGSRGEAAAFFRDGGFSGADVIVNDDGSLVSATKLGKTLPCQVVSYNASNIAGLNHEIKFRVAVPPEMRDAVLGCEVVIARSSPGPYGDGQHSFFVARAKACGKGYLIPLDSMT